MEDIKDKNRPEHSARGGYHRQGGLLHAGERASGKHTLGDFLGGHTKKEHHKDIVDDIMEAEGMPEGLEIEKRRIDKSFITFQADIGPYKRKRGADEQKSGVLPQATEGACEGVGCGHDISALIRVGLCEITKT